MAKFSEQVAAWNKKAVQQVDKDVRGITLSLFSRVILESPVGNPELWAVNSAAKRAWRAKHGRPEIYKPPGYSGGRFRANWTVSIGSPDYTVTDEKDKSGMVTIGKAKRNMGGAGTVTYMSNALPYAYALEFQGHSGQAPLGMVRINVAKVAELAKAEKAL